MKSEDHPLIRGDNSFMSVAANFLSTQLSGYIKMSVKMGIQIQGKAKASMLREYKHLNAGVMPGKPVFEYIDPTEITSKDRKKVLEAVNLTKKEKCGKIKGRVCANGSKQKRCLNMVKL